MKIAKIHVVRLWLTAVLAVLLVCGTARAGQSGTGLELFATSNDARPVPAVAASSVLIAGGLDFTGNVIASAELYSPISGGFSATDSMTDARLGHIATLLPNHQVLVAGGIDDSFVIVRSADLYDPGSGLFNPTGNMVASRFGATATLLGSGKVLITGGQNLKTTLRSTELYNPNAGTFAATGAMLSPRVGHTATLLPNGKVLIVGGTDLLGLVQASAELYDPVAGHFTRTGSLTHARAGHTATLLPTGKVLIAGGNDDSGFALAAAELFDPASGHFSNTGLMKVARLGHSATRLGGGRVLIAGGEDNTNATLGAGAGKVFASAELYDPITGHFTLTVGKMTSPRVFHAAALLSTGSVLIAGGVNPYSITGDLASAELFVPAAGTFKRTGAMTTTRGGPSATVLK